MKKIKELLEKIKYYLKKILKKEDVLLISESVDIEAKIEENSTKTEDIELEKRDFFRIYENVKKGIISMDTLMIDDLIKVLQMMQNEVLVYDDKINNCKNNIINLETEINILEKENETMKMKLKNQLI